MSKAFSNIKLFDDFISFDGQVVFEVKFEVSGLRIKGRQEYKKIRGAIDLLTRIPAFPACLSL